MRPVHVGMIAALGVALVALFWNFLHKQHQHSWRNPEDWGHAYLIPAIAGYLVWRNRAALTRAGASVFWPGLAPIVVGVLMYWSGVLQESVHMLQGLGMVLCVFGASLLMLGPRAMRYLFLPIAYLVFAITLPEQVMISITFKLQLLASRGAWVMLSMIGAPGDWFSVEVEGNTLTLLHNGRAIPMNVAEACSGMRMVVAFYALAASVALLACRHWWQRILLILLAGPVAVFMNIVRVAVLGLASLADANLAAGDAHTLIGTLLLLPSLMLFLGIVWALNRIAPAPAGGAGP